MAWRRPGDKPLSKPVMVKLLMHISVTQPQWVTHLTTSSIHMWKPQLRHHYFISQWCQAFSRHNNDYTDYTNFWYLSLVTNLFMLYQTLYKWLIKISQKSFNTAELTINPAAGFNAKESVRSEKSCVLIVGKRLSLPSILKVPMCGSALTDGWGSIISMGLQWEEQQEAPTHANTDNFLKSIRISAGD